MSKILLLLCALDATNAISYVPKAEAGLGERSVQRHIGKTTVYTTGNQARGQTSTGGITSGVVITASTNGVSVAIGADGQEGADDYVKDATIGHLSSVCNLKYVAVHGARNTLDAANGFDQTAKDSVDRLFLLLQQKKGLSGSAIHFDVISNANDCHAECLKNDDCAFFTYITTGFAFEQVHGICFLKGTKGVAGACTGDAGDYTHSNADWGKLSGARDDVSEDVKNADRENASGASTDVSSAGCAPIANKQYGSSLSGACADGILVTGEGAILADKSDFLTRFLDQHHPNKKRGDALSLTDGAGVEKTADALALECKEICAANADCYAWNYLPTSYFIGGFRNSCWLMQKINECAQTIGTGWPAINSFTGTKDSC